MFTLLMKKNKAGQSSFVLIDIIAGLVVIAGGVLIALSYANLGVVFTSVGLLIEAIKFLARSGL